MMVRPSAKRVELMETAPHQQSLDGASQRTSRRWIQVGIVLLGIGLGLQAVGLMQMFAVSDAVASMERGPNSGGITRRALNAMLLVGIGEPLLLAGLVMIVVFSSRRGRSTGSEGSSAAPPE